MTVIQLKKIAAGFLMLVFFFSTCKAIKCFDCSSVNNSACLDLNLQHMNSIVPIVDCGRSLPEILSKEFFCRKMVQTILHPEKTPEVRVMRGCGWVKHIRECYMANNADHLETVCQCFGDMCNAAVTFEYVKMTVLGLFVTVVLNFKTWRGYV